MKKIATPKKEAATKYESHYTTKSTRPPFKIEVAAMAFIDRGNQGMNSLEANRQYGDTALHTSVSTLTHDHGINFKRQPEDIENRAGAISRFTRYSLLTDDDVKRAMILVNYYRCRRGLSPLVWEAQS